MNYGRIRPHFDVAEAVTVDGLDLVEGVIRSGAKVLLVDDVVTDAATKLVAQKAISAFGGTVEDILVIFDRQQSGSTILRQNNLKLASLTDMTSALNIGRNIRAVSGDAFNSVTNYLESPAKWHDERNLPYIEA